MNLALVQKIALISQFIFFSLTNQRIFNEGIIGQPSNLTPHIGRQNEIDRDISQILFPQLLEYNLRGDLTPSLAKSWEISDNSLAYRFLLRDDQFWSNGRQITADDVIFTAQNASAVKNIEVQKLGDFDVKFFLKEPYAPFLSILTLKIIPKEAHPGLEPITLKGRETTRVVRSGQHINEILVHTSQSGKNYVNFLAYKFYDNDADLETAAKLGEVDAFYGQDFSSQNFYAIDFPLKARRYGLFYNLENETLKDKSLRVKLSKAINRGKITSLAFNNLAEPLDIPDVLFDNNQYPVGNKNITLTVTNEESQLKTAEIIKEAWEALGVNVTVLPLPFWDISTRVIDTKDFEVLLFGQELTRDPDEYTLWHSTKTDYPGLNISQLNNQRVDQALEEGRKEMDPEKRAEAYRNFQTILNEELPAMFLYRPIYRWNVSKKYEEMIKRYVTAIECCDGCQCDEIVTPDLYYPWERFNLLPL